MRKTLLGYCAKPFKYRGDRAAKYIFHVPRRQSQIESVMLGTVITSINRSYPGYKIGGHLVPAWLDPSCQFGGSLMPVWPWAHATLAYPLMPMRHTNNRLLTT